MAFKIEYTLKNGSRSSMVLGSKATAERTAKSLKEAVITEVKVHAPVVHPKAVKAASEAQQRKSATAFYKSQKERTVDVSLSLQAEMTEAEETRFFADAVEFGVPEWRAQQVLRRAKQELKRKTG